MNCREYEDFRLSLKTLHDDHLIALEKCLESKENEKDKAEKMELLNLEIERRHKMRRYYESYVY